MKTFQIILTRATLPITITAIIGYLVLAFTVAMPFTTTVKYDPALTQPHMTDPVTLSGIIALIPLIIGFILMLQTRLAIKDGQQPSLRLLKAIRICGLCFMGSLLILVLSLALKAVAAYDNPVWHYWASQSMGMLGLFMYPAIRLLWKLKRNNSGNNAS